MNHISPNKVTTRLQYGWERNRGSHDSILTNSLPTPSKLTELSGCGCKGNCRNSRCKQVLQEGICFH